MVNDTTTLNGALMELGDTIANNLNTKGVQTSSNDGLTTLAGKILDIEQKSDMVILYSHEKILSLADQDSITFIAVLSTLQTGQTVALYDEEDNFIANMTDNDDGTYTYVYNSQGIGDMGFYAKWGMILSETYSIEDCIKYVPNVSSTTNYDIDLPSAFKVSAIINPVSRSNATASVHIGTDANNKMFIGQTGSDGIMNLLKRYNGSYVQNRFNSLSELNTDNYIECTYSNEVYTCKFNNETITDNTGNITPSKLLTIETNSNIIIKDIKIKPL